MGNQHCGIYAGDWDSYKDFAPVFDPIIQEYHGISADSKHTSDMDASKINGNMVLTSSRLDVRNFIFSPVELVVSLVVRLVTLMTFPTSTDLDTLRLSLSRK